MGIRLESTSAGPMGSGFLPVQEGSQAHAHINIAQRAQLPERYGIPLLELLVVDPYFVFISWEITPEQLEQARKQFGAAFHERRLLASMLDAETSTVLEQRELYGEVGRWFIRLYQPGIWLRAELAFVHGNNELELNSAGPVFIPRDAPLEPTAWEELLVTYSKSDKGELRLESVETGTSGQPRIVSLGSFSDPLAIAETSPWPRHVGAAQLRPLLPQVPDVEDQDD